MFLKKLYTSWFFESSSNNFNRIWEKNFQTNFSRIASNYWSNPEFSTKTFSFSSVDIVDREAIGVSNIFLKLLLFNKMIIMSDLGREELVNNFFRQMTQLTCHFAEKASQHDSVIIWAMFYT